MSYYLEIIGDRGIVIPNAINEEFVRETFRGLRKKKIVSAGRLTSQKNFALLIEGFAKIANKHPDYKLVIYGDGPQKGKLQRLTKDLGISEKVEFPGYVNDFGDYIIDASLFVMSSNFEGMPNALMEAMALGLPCISTDCPSGGPKFLIKNGINGFLIPVGDVDKLANIIDLVLSDKKLSQKVGENAYSILEELSNEKIYQNWENYLTHIYNESKGKIV
jgi:glycosyltransferase involved in cell wall biosynthesis